MLLVVLFFICVLILAVGILYWHLESLTEKKLQDYVKRLEEDGFTVDESRLSDFNFSGVVPVHFFSDFRSFAKQKGISQILLDRGIKALFFLHSINSEVEAVAFYYYK